MDGTSAWPSLAVRFTELGEADRYRLSASWSSTPFNEQGEHWHIGGSPEALVYESFRWAAERAAVLLGQPAGESTLFYWLDLLRENSPRYKGGGTSLSYVENRCVDMAETGVILALCLASAEYCYKLETEAIAKDRAQFRPVATFPSDLPRSGYGAHQWEAHVDARIRARAQIEYEKHLRKLREAEERKTDVSPASPQPDPTPVAISSDDTIAAERQMLLNTFKRRGKACGIKITDEMVATAAKSSWNTRTMVTWWKRNDKRCKPIHDRLIRTVLAKHPKSIWPAT